MQCKKKESTDVKQFLNQEIIRRSVKEVRGVCVGDIGDRRLEDQKIGRLEDWKMNNYGQKKIERKKKKNKNTSKKGGVIIVENGSEIRD